MKGARIKQLREERRLTQTELADKLKISNSAIAMYETDKREPSDDIKLKMCELFNCSLDYLVGRTDIRSPEKIEDDPLGLAKIGFSMKDYNPPTETQKEQIKVIIETILKDNKKDLGDK